MTSTKNKKTNYSLVFVTIVNALIVISIHIKWEVENTFTFKQELALLKKEDRKIELGYTWFKKSIEERLKIYGIKYAFVSNKKIRKKPHKKLSNVPKGYPGSLLYFKKK